jgi:hypothetical protein
LIKELGDRGRVIADGGIGVYDFVGRWVLENCPKPLNDLMGPLNLSAQQTMGLGIWSAPTSRTTKVLFQLRILTKLSSSTSTGMILYEYLYFY